MSDAVPEGYSYAPSPSAFPNHVGRIFHKTVELPGGEAEKWSAPKLGQLLEMRSQATRRTRSLVFVDAQAFADGELQFTATAVNKVIGG